MDWLAANYPLLKQIWVVWFLAVFVGIVFWAYRPSNKAALEVRGRIPLDDDRDGREAR